MFKAPFLVIQRQAVHESKLETSRGTSLVHEHIAGIPAQREQACRDPRSALIQAMLRLQIEDPVRPEMIGSHRENLLVLGWLEW